MKINTKIRYSLRILYILAKEDAILNTTELAKKGNLSPFYLRQIVIPLEKEGMLKSTRGIKGGYKLARSAKDITVLSVAQSFGENFNLLECVSDKTSCEFSNSCNIINFWGALSNTIIDFVKNTTIEDFFTKYKMP